MSTLVPTAKLFHPDVRRDSGIESSDVFKVINEAYGVLSDVAARAEYDKRFAVSGADPAKLKKRNEGDSRGPKYTGVDPTFAGAFIYIIVYLLFAL